MVSSTTSLVSSHWNPPDQFMMYGGRILGSIQDALRPEKFEPTNGALPLGAILNAAAPGPCDSLNAGRGSPTGDCTEAVAKYSSKFWLRLVMNRSCVRMPKLLRNTIRGRKFQASPTRGWKDFQ